LSGHILHGERGTPAAFAGLYQHCLVSEFQKPKFEDFGDFAMDRSDQQLLDKQLRSLDIAPRNGGTMILTVLGVFFTGMALGGFLYAFTGEPRVTASQVALNDMPAILQPHGLPSYTR
jgi:hypothetical protein